MLSSIEIHHCAFLKWNGGLTILLFIHCLLFKIMTKVIICYNIYRFNQKNSISLKIAEALLFSEKIIKTAFNLFF